jgi:predicted outer membrane repeat protein
MIRALSSNLISWIYMPASARIPSVCTALLPFQRILLALSIALLIGLPVSAAAQTYTVTTLTDDASGVASNCSNQALSGTSPDSSCSLRDALAAAAAVNGAAGTAPVTVNFASSLAVVGNPGIIRLGANVLALPTYTTIQGLTAGSGYALTNLITINGSGHLALSTSSTVTNAALNNLTITNGTPGLNNAGSVTISQSTFSGNSTTTYGGAIANSGTLTVRNSTFTNNSASSYGGAIYSTGSSSPAAVATTQNVTISGSTFRGNSSVMQGGALYIGILSVGGVDSSTFTGNTAGQDGAAIFINNASGLSRVTNSILTGDTGGNECGGGGCDNTIRALVFAGSEPSGATDRGIITVTITLSTGQVATVTGQYGEFSTGASLASSYGPALYYGYSPTLTGESFGSTLEIQASTATITSIVVTNPSTYFTVTPVGNSVLSGTGNVVAVGSAAANLSALGSYGGPTQTALPLPGSAALCTITPASSNGSDQRGLARTTTFGTTLCQDAGAVQTNYGLAFAQQPASTTVTTVLSPSPSVQLSENGQNLAQANVSLTVNDRGSNLTGLASRSTVSTGIATFSGIAVSKAQLADTLTASLLVGANTVSATSNSFDVTAQTTANLTGVATFPATVLGFASTPQVFTFINTGHATLFITSIAVTGGDFTQTNTCGLSLAAGASCTLSITFQPVTTGTRSGTLSVMSNASGYAAVSLTGTGVASSFTLSDASGAASTAITIAAGSTGTASLKLTSVNGFAGSVMLACTAQGTAPAGAGCTVSSPATLTAGSSTTAAVSISTTARTQTAGLGAMPRRGRTAWVLLLIAAMLLGARTQPSAIRGGSLLAMLFVFAMALAGCGSKTTSTASSNGTPAGSYAFMVTATGGGVTQTETIVTTVQ